MNQWLHKVEEKFSLASCAIFQRGLRRATHVVILGGNQVPQGTKVVTSGLIENLAKTATPCFKYKSLNICCFGFLNLILCHVVFAK